VHLTEVSPAPCLVCGRGNTPNGEDHSRPRFVDLERDVNWNDPAVLCEDCALKVGTMIGMLTPDDKRDHDLVVKNKDKEIHRLKAENDSLHRRYAQRRRARAGSA
jgi:hypothetical protein